MEISRTDKGLLLAGLDLFLVELLQQIPVSADPSDSDAARERLFSKPADEPETNQEWKDYVEPELAELFESAMETVKRDLKRVRKDENSVEGEYRLRIPPRHYDAWLNALNQARLALAARHGFSEKDLDHDRLTSLATARDLSLFQIHFYGFLQECLVHEMNG